MNTETNKEVFANDEQISFEELMKALDADEFEPFVEETDDEVVPVEEPTVH